MYRPAGMSDEDSDSDMEYFSSANATLQNTSNYEDQPCFTQQSVNKTQEPLPNSENFSGNGKSKDNMHEENLLSHDKSKGYFSLERSNNQISNVNNTDDRHLSSSNYLQKDHYGQAFKSNSSRLSPISQPGKSSTNFSMSCDEFKMAAVQGNLSIIKLLHSQGMAIDQLLKSGWTALMFACSSGKPIIVKYLLQHGADPNMHKELFTPLMSICASSYENEAVLLECLNALLDYGAKVGAAERHRMTALMFACKEGKCLLVQRLISASADVNQQDNRGWSALCWAASKGHGKVIRLLLENSADPNLVNSFGQRPADVALTSGFPEIADVLERVISNDYSLVRHIPDSEKQKESVVSSIKYGELEMVLSGLDMAYLIDLFHKNEVNFEDFLRLTDSDLEKMGISAIGVRKKILQVIREMHFKDWKTTSLPNLSSVANLSLTEVVGLIGNITKHVRFIHASIGYVRDRVQDSPKILEVGQEAYSVSSLAEQCDGTMKCIKALGDEVKYLKMHLDKVSGNAEFVPADLIIEKKDNGKRWQRRMLAPLVTMTVVFAILCYSKPEFLKTPLFPSFSRSTTVLMDL